MILLSVSIAAFLGSLLVRFIAEALLSDRVSLMGSTIGLEHVENGGIAFGIDLPGWLLLILIPLALILIAHLAWQSRSQKIPSIGFGLILGGALGNIVDRFDDGFVTDFIQIGWWPVFNLADICISIGVGLLIVFEFIVVRNRKSY